MSIRSEIRAAIIAGKTTRAAMLKACPSCEDDKHLASNLHVLKTESKVTYTIGDNGGAVYALGVWPEKAERDDAAPSATRPPKAAKKPAAKKKASARKHQHRKAVAKRPAAAPIATPTPAGNVRPFIPSITADDRLVIVGGTEPLIFTPEQTADIATLLARFAD